ncbi:MAG: thioredoxin family protein [Spirochaetes bacterium]|jgi:glutaredoxin-like protein|nr:thioredoxin family protein [Spirochaetota bacterium]
MAIFDDKVRKQIGDILAKLADRVNLLYFTQEMECGICKETHEFLNEFTSLSDKIGLVVFDFVKDRDKAAHYGVDKIPAIVLLDKNDNDAGLRFFGLPGGYEINSFIQSIFEVSGLKEPLPAKAAEALKKIDKDIHLQVFISLTCPYCPAAVSAAHRIALESPRVRADMVDAGAFPQLAVKYNVSSVPKTVINETIEIIGAEPIEKLIEAAAKA